MQMHFLGIFLKDVVFFFASFAFFFFASVLPLVLLFCGKPWTDVYHVVLQIMLLPMLMLPLS